MYSPYLTYEQREDIREDGNLIGGIVLLITAALTLGFTVLIVALMRAGVITPAQLAQKDLGLGNTGYMLLYMCTYAVFMGVPSLLVFLLFRRRMPRIAAVGKIAPATRIWAFLVGVGGCAAANYVASYVAAILDSFGIAPPDNPTYMEQTPQSLLINLVVLALLPALLEELTFRKCILGTLQKYGQGVAVVMSALLFGAMHGGISQSVFAFLVGLVLGFITVKTGNVWIAVMVHFVNNSLSVLVEYATSGMDGNIQGFAYTVVIGITGLCGFVALIVSAVQKNELFSKAPPPVCAVSNRVGILWKTPLMVIATVLLLLRALYVNI